MTRNCRRTSPNYMSMRLTQMIVLISGNAFFRPVGKINSEIESYPNGMADYRRSRVNSRL